MVITEFIASCYSTGTRDIMYYTTWTTIDGNDATLLFLDLEWRRRADLQFFLNTYYSIITDPNDMHCDSQ